MGGFRRTRTARGSTKWFKASGNNILATFKDEQAKELFITIDVSVPRAAELSVHIPETNHKEHTEEFYCDSTDGNDTECMKEFGSYKARVAHIRRYYTEGSIYHVNTVTNQCPFCMSIFASQLSAAQHVRRACTSEQSTWTAWRQRQHSQVHRLRVELTGHLVRRASSCRKESRRGTTRFYSPRTFRSCWTSRASKRVP